MQNLDAVIYTIHFVRCFEKKEYSSEVNEISVQLGIKYMTWVAHGYKKIIELLNAGKPASAKEKILAFFKRDGDKFPYSWREIYRGKGTGKPNKDEVMSALQDVCSMDERGVTGYLNSR